MSLLPKVATQVPYRTAIGASCSLGIAALTVGLTSPPSTGHAPTALPAIAAPSPRSPAAVLSTLPAALAPAPPAPEVHSNQLMFVFRAGGSTYMRIADLRTLDQDGDELPVPRHGKLRLAKDDYIDAAIAPVADRDVPLMHLVWKDRKVKVDGSCEASVAGFAVVSRVVGDPAGPTWSSGTLRA